MSLVMEILEQAWNTRLNYKGVTVNMFGFPMIWKSNSLYQLNSVYTTFKRLRDNKMVEVKDGNWTLTEKGKKYFEDKKKLSIKFNSPFPLNAPKNLLLMFDIPESKRAERNWLRWHLREFQYCMIQQSVWVGPTPLPNKFREHVKGMGLDKCIKTFKLAKPYQTNNNSHLRRPSKM